MWVQKSGVTLVKAHFVCGFARCHALKTSYHLFAFTSFTGYLLYGFAPSMILSVQTCLRPVPHVTGPSGTVNSRHLKFQERPIT